MNEICIRRNIAELRKTYQLITFLNLSFITQLMNVTSYLKLKNVANVRFLDDYDFSFDFFFTVNKQHTKYFV